MYRRVTKEMRNGRGVFLLAAVLLILGVWVWVRFSAANLGLIDARLGSDVSEQLAARFSTYCHLSLLNSSYSDGGLEGRLEIIHSKSDFELIHVHIIARHGDRSPAHDLSLGKTPYFQCGLVDKDKKWLGLKDFNVEPLPPTARINSKRLSPFPGFKDKQCGLGTLTDVGFKQEYALGSLMRTKYKRFASTVSPEEMFVHSTDYSRTVQSASAFLLGFLPNDSELRQAIPIHTSIGDNLASPPTGMEEVYPPCKNLYQFLVQQWEASGYKSESKKYQYLLKELRSMFNLPKKAAVTEQPITHYFDLLMTRSCHQFPLPCSGKKLKKKCVNETFALELFNYADWAWSQRYPHNFSIISVQPFIQHSVVDVMEAVLNEGGDKEHAFKVMLSFTHDSTIAQLLSSFGITVNSWMPYASRVVIELWKPKQQSRGQPRHFVRVLFNGENVTPKLGIDRKLRGLDREFVQYSAWKKLLVMGEYRQMSTYNQICGTEN